MLVLIYFFKNYYSIVPYIPFFPIYWFEKQEEWWLKFVKYRGFYAGDLYGLLLSRPHSIWRMDENWKRTWKHIEYDVAHIIPSIEWIWYYKNWEKKWEWIYYHRNWKIESKGNYINWKEDWIWIHYYNNWKDIEMIEKYDNWRSLEIIKYYKWGQIEFVWRMTSNWMETKHYNEDGTLKRYFGGDNVFYEENLEENSESEILFSDSSEISDINNVVWNRIQNVVEYSRDKTIVTYKWIWWEKISDDDLQEKVNFLLRWVDWDDGLFYQLDLSEVKNFTEEQLDKLSLIEENHKIIYNENLEK